MDQPNTPIVLGGRLRAKISYHFMIEGYPDFSRQQYAVRVKNGRRVPKVLRDVARQVVALFYIFLSEHQDDPAEGADKVVFGPGGIAVEDLYLYELRQINTASVEVRLGYKPSQRQGVTRNFSAQPSALPGVAAPESRKAVASSSALCGRWQLNSTGAAIPTSAGRSAFFSPPTHSYPSPILAHANPVAGDIVYPTHRHALEAAGSSPSAYEDTSSLQPSQHHGIERRDLLASSLGNAPCNWFNQLANNTMAVQTLLSDFPAPIASPPRLVPSLPGDSLPPRVYPTGVSYPEEAGFTSGQPAFAPASWLLSDQAAQYHSLEAAWPFPFIHPTFNPPLLPLDDNEPRTF